MKSGKKSEKSHNNGKWTQSRFNSFIRGALRQAWMRWPPNQQTKKNARIKRGTYLCQGWKRKPHQVTSSVLIEGKRKNNIFTDHIEPIGKHTDWNITITRMFCEEDNLQLLCRKCHDRKTKEEKK